MGTLFLMGDPTNEEDRMNHRLVISLSFLIPHYIFGLIFLLGTKWIFKLIVPFLTAITSFGIIWLIGKTGLIDIIDYGMSFLLVLFIPIVAVWEVVYQILKRKNDDDSQIIDCDETN
jgi:hypothetical protein